MNESHLIAQFALAILRWLHAPFRPRRIASGLLTFSKRMSKAHVRPTIYRVRALAPLAPLTYLSPLSTQTRTRFRQLTWVVVSKTDPNGRHFAPLRRRGVRLLSRHEVLKAMKKVCFSRMIHDMDG